MLSYGCCYSLGAPSLFSRAGTPGREHATAWTIPVDTSATLATAAACGREGRREAVPVVHEQRRQSVHCILSCVDLNVNEMQR